MEIVLAVVSIGSLTAAGILLNSLRYRRREVQELEAKLRLEDDRCEILSEDLRIEKVLRKEVLRKLRNSHQRVGKKLLPMGTNPDGTKV